MNRENKFEQFFFFFFFFFFLGGESFQYLKFENVSH